MDPPIGSSRVDRRKFLDVAGRGALLGAAAIIGLPHAASAATTVRTHGGPTLSGWTTVVGDGSYAPAGASPVSARDIAVEVGTADSRLGANIQSRGVMAHVISYKKLSHTRMMHVAHRAGYSFRLPYLPTPVHNQPRNGQTVEGGLFVWDGADTRLDHGTAFQWVLNPWLPTFGEVLTWNTDAGEGWVPGGFLTPDTEWHTVSIDVDPMGRDAEVLLDGIALSAQYSLTPKVGWGTDTSARLQVEAISIWPGAQASWAPQHEVMVKDWTWKQT